MERRGWEKLFIDGVDWVLGSEAAGVGGGQAVMCVRVEAVDFVG